MSQSSPSSALALVLFALGAALAPVSTVQGRVTPADENPALSVGLPNFRDVVQTVAPSVVNISATIPASAARHSTPGGLFDLFGGPDNAPMPSGQSQGSGVIVSADGLVLTNNHVINGADRIVVRLANGIAHRAVVVGVDAQTDLAVLRIEADQLMPAVMARSDNLEVGDWVLAVGNPFGLSNTVTAGIVSAKGRDRVGLAKYEDFIQTDAAINPGNSGGPLVDLRGQVVGINTAIASRTGSYTGVGFAIPASMASHVMERLIEDGTVDRGWLGVYIEDVRPDRREQFGLPQPGGALVTRVVPGGPAESGGLATNDVIIAVGEHLIDSSSALSIAVAELTPYSDVLVQVIRNGRARALPVTLGKLGQPQTAETPRQPDDLGLYLTAIDESLVERLDLSLDHGLLVTGVDPRSLAARASIAPGSIVLSVNGRRVDSLNAYNAAVAATPEGVRLELNVNGQRRAVTLRARQ